MPQPIQERLPALAFIFLLFFAAALPHSIAISQSAAALAAFCWVLSMLVRRERPPPTPLSAAILAFLAASALAAVFSLEPRISVDKLPGTSLVLVVLLVPGLVRTRARVLLLVAVLLASAAAGAGLTVWDKAWGRGVDVVALTEDSPLRAANVRERDVILSCAGRTFHRPEQFEAVLRAHDASSPLRCQGVRTGMIPYEFQFPAALWDSPLALDTWGYQLKTGRWLRARGTFSHYVTYADVLLQLTALAAGLWLGYHRKRSGPGVGLLVLAGLLALALLATYTRAPLAALALGGFAMLWIRFGRRARIAALIALPLVLLGLNALLVEVRGVGFYNSADLSMQYRRLMWTDGLRLISEHPLLGVGMDTVLLRWKELGVRAYDELQLHSHFHSTPIQLAVERGLVGLLAWATLMGLYVRLLWRLVARTRRAADPWLHGLALGIFGATAGFLLNGLLHYNFGDSEVAMLFWFLAGLAVALDQLDRMTKPAPTAGGLSPPR